MRYRLDGSGDAADVLAKAAAIAGWEQVKRRAHVDVVAGAQTFVTHSDGRRVFAWPLVSSPAMQEFVRRARSVGDVTSLSARVAARDLWAAHDHVAMLALLAKVVGLGDAVLPALTSPDVAVNEIQLSGTDGVLRFDAPLLERNGEQVRLASRGLLYDSGYVDMFRSIDAVFAGTAPPPLAMSTEFAAEVQATIEAAAPRH